MNRKIKIMSKIESTSPALVFRLSELKVQGSLRSAGLMPGLNLPNPKNVGS